jgi:hypothetical protein
MLHHLSRLHWTWLHRISLLWKLRGLWRLLLNNNHSIFFLRAATLVNAEHAGHLLAFIEGRDTAAPHCFQANSFSQ